MPPNELHTRHNYFIWIILDVFRFATFELYWHLKLFITYLTMYMLVIWMMVTCLTVCHLWTRRCKFVFQQHKLLSGEVLLNIWFDLVSWLRGRYDSIKGELDEAKKVRSKFLLKWGNSPMVDRSSSGPKWNYKST